MANQNNSFQSMSMADFSEMISYDNIIRTYKPKTSSKIKPGGIIYQETQPLKPEVIPLVDTTSPDPAPISTEDPAKDLQERIDEVKSKLGSLQTDAKEPTIEPFKEEPSLIRSVAVVELIDRKKTQTLRGAQTFEKVKSAQNENWFTRKGSQWAAEAKVAVSRIARGSLSAIEHQIAHPVANTQRMIPEPFEKRDIFFIDQVTKMIKKTVFPDNPELALVLPEEFIQVILRNAQKDRGEWFKGLGSTSKIIWNNAKDIINPLVSLGFIPDTQQKRAIEYLTELIKHPDSQKFKDLKEASLNYSSNLAHGFSLTLTDGKKAIDDQTAIGNRQILIPGESRQEVAGDKKAQVEGQIKAALKGYFEPTSTAPTPEQELEIIKKINEIYRDAGLISEKELAKGEFANDIILELREMLKDKDFFRQKWAEVQFVSYIGKSKGEALGGQERFTANEKISLWLSAADNFVARGAGTIPPAIIAAAKTAIYLGGYVPAWAIGVFNLTPRLAASSKLRYLLPGIGPFWAGAYGAATQSLDVHIGPIKRESRMTLQQRDVSRGVGLGEHASELDYVRSQLEREATVTPIPATELTKSITDLVLTDPNNWHSEHKELNKDQVLQLFINIAHARARLESTHKSGSKELNFTTQNWISYTRNFEQQELTDLKASFLYGYSHLMNLQNHPELFDQIPFYDTAKPESLDASLEAMTKIISYGLEKGLPQQILDGSPFNGHKKTKFYNQIFSASGIPKEQIAQVEEFINNLKNSAYVFAGKKMSEWLAESESFKAKNKALGRLKRENAIVVGGISLVVGAVAAEAQQMAAPVIVEHVVKPIGERFAIHGQPKPPDITYSQPQTINIPLSDMFKMPSNGVARPFHIFNQSTGKVEEVKIPLGEGFKFLTNKDSNDKNVDIQGPDGKIYDNVFIFDPQHQAVVPNPHFIPDPAHPTLQINLGRHIHFKVENQSGVGVTGGKTTNFWDKVADYRLVWAHSKEIKPDKDFIFTTTGPGHENHPYGIEIRFANDSIRDPDTGAIAPLFSHFDNNTMAAVLNIKDYFGPGKDGHLLLNNCVERVPDGKGGFYGSLKFDPTSNKTLSFADGTEITMAEVAQIVLNEKELLNHPKIGFPNDTEFHGANVVFGFKGSILIGYKTKAPATVASAGGLAGHQVVPGGSATEIFEPVHYVSANGVRNDGTIIAPPGEPVTTLIPPTPFKVTIPGEPITPPPVATNYPPLPVATTSLPELKPTEKKVVSPPSPSKVEPVIDSSGFKKEKQPVGYTNQEAFSFLSHLPENQNTGHLVDDFIFTHVFNQTQNKFISLPTTVNFVNSDLASTIPSNLKDINEKMKNGKQLSQSERAQLKTVILAEGKDKGLTDQESLTVYAFITHRAYLRALHSAIKEKKQLDDELRQLNDALNEVHAANATPLPTQNPPKPVK
jgi:hypothetical protein